MDVPIDEAAPSGALAHFPVCRFTFTSTFTGAQVWEAGHGRIVCRFLTEIGLNPKDRAILNP